MTPWRLPENGAARRYALAALVDATGSGMVMPVAVMYFTAVVHLPPGQVGAGLSLAGVCGVLASVPAGPLIDRLGCRRVLIGAYLLAGLGYLLYDFAVTFPAFLAATCLARVALRAGRPARTALISAAVPERERVETMACVYGLQNAALGLGSLIAAVALLSGTRVAYLILFTANVASYIVAAGLIRSLAVPAAGQRPTDTPRGSWRPLLSDRRYLTLAGLAAVLSLQHNVLTLAIPLWLRALRWSPASLPAVLYLLNTVLVVALQARIGHIGRSMRGGVTAFRLAGWTLGLACLLLAVTPAGPGPDRIAWLVLAVASLSFGELYSGVGQWTSSMQLAPEPSRGRYLSVYSGAQAIEDCAGPALVTLLVVHQGRYGWAALAGLLAGAAALSGTVLSGTVRHRDTPRGLAHTGKGSE